MKKYALRVWNLTLIVAVVAAALLISGSAAQAGMIDVANPQNVLAGATTVNVSSTLGGFGPASAAVDNLAADTYQDAPFIFGDAEALNQMSISGFSGGFATIRIFSAGGVRDPVSITLKSSTSVRTTLVAGDYETALGTFAVTGVVTQHLYDGNDRFYYDLNLASAAPAGTQSLYLEATPQFRDPDWWGTRFYEIQGIPEPGTLALLATGLFCLVAYAWRKRR